MNTLDADGAQSCRKPILLTGGLILVAILGNSFGVLLFSSVIDQSNSELTNSILCFAIGALIAEPCLLAVWAALSPQRLSRRILFSLGTLVLLTSVYLFALASIDGPTLTEVFLVVSAISLGLYVIAMVPAFLFRWKSRHVLSNQEDVGETDQSVQFGIRHIFILMTVVAILIPIAQRVFDQFGPDRGEPWLEISVFIALYSLLTWCAFLFTVACVFAIRRPLYWISLVFFLVTFPGIVSFLMSSYFISFQPWDSENWIYGVCFAVCFSITMIAVFSMYRSIGYRLRPFKDS